MLVETQEAPEVMQLQSESEDTLIEVLVLSPWHMPDPSQKLLFLLSKGMSDLAVKSRLYEERRKWKQENKARATIPDSCSSPSSMSRNLPHWLILNKNPEMETPIF